jgi:para-aminobenzoate synthetase/4-amino-4-deoxychorismate lyase
MGFATEEGKRSLMLSMSAPFVLLDDAASDRPGRLYRQPIDIVETREPSEVRSAIRRLREAARQGLHCAGFLSYEAGHMLETKLEPLCGPPAPDAPPLIWFGLFRDVEEADVAALLPDPASAWTGGPRPLIERQAYEAAVERAKGHIEAGDI